MWIQECYHLCLSIHRTQEHVDVLVRSGLLPGSHSYAKLEELLKEAKDLFMRNTCPLLPVEAPQPVDDDVLGEVPNWYPSDVAAASSELSLQDIAVSAVVAEELRALRGRYARVTKGTGMATLRDVRLVLGDAWTPDDELVEFFDQYFTCVRWDDADAGDYGAYALTSTATDMTLADALTAAPGTLRRHFRGAVLHLAGVAFWGVFTEDRLQTVQQAMPFLPTLLSSRIRAASGPAFKSLPLRDLLTLRPEQMDEELKTRRVLHGKLQGMSRLRLRQLCKNRSLAYGVRVLELLAVTGRPAYAAAVLDGTPALRRVWAVLRCRRDGTAAANGAADGAIDDAGVPAAVLAKIRKMEAQAVEGDKYEIYVDLLRRFPWTGDPPAVAWGPVQRILDAGVYGHAAAKQQVRRLVVKWARNPGGVAGACVGLCGPPGVGKTHFARCLGEALGLPLISVHLGGQRDPDLLVGHGFTYSSARPGVLVQRMADCASRRAILFFDEADKASTDLTNVLIHLTDPETNHKFQDRFFASVDFDFSECVCLFSYNDASRLDPILRDRLEQLSMEPFLSHQKVDLAQRHLLPVLRDRYDVPTDWLTPTVVGRVVRDYTREAGVRGLKRHLETLVADAAIEADAGRPARLTPAQVRRSLRGHRVHPETRPGCVHGLYATDMGVGGACPVMVTSAVGAAASVAAVPPPMVPSLSTGSLGDVFRESISVAEVNAARTARAVGAAPRPYHMHVPAGGTKKDGPSAGLAATLALHAFYTGAVPRPHVAVTGEVDIHGHVHAIGGLAAKVTGALNNGCGTVVLPQSNQDEFRRLYAGRRAPVKAHFVRAVDEAIPLVLEAEAGDTRLDGREHPP
jgi:hypothetical protein